MAERRPRGHAVDAPAYRWEGRQYRVDVRVLSALWSAVRMYRSTDLDAHVFSLLVAYL